MERRKRYLLGNGESGRTLRTHGEGGTNASQSREQVVATLERWNQPGRLRHNFSESKESVLIRFDLNDGSRVAITKPVNPYTPETFLVTAFEPNGPKKQLTADYVYEKSDQLQYKYWQTTLAQMLALEKQNPLEQTTLIPAVDEIRHSFRRLMRKTDPKRYVFFMENTGPLSYIDDKFRKTQLDGYSPRTSRTASAIHLHISAIDEKWLTPGMRDMPELQREKQAIRDLQNSHTGKEFITQLSRNIADNIEDKNMRDRFLCNTKLIVEEGTPTGYSIQFTDVNTTNALFHVAYFAKVMQAHFVAYKKSQDMLFGEKTQEVPIPQPSLRTYGTFEKASLAKNRTLVITFSPQIFSYGGPLEAAGVELQRGPDFPTLGTNEQKNVYRNRLMSRTRREMWDRKYEVRRIRKFTEPEWP